MKHKKRKWLRIVSFMTVGVMLVSMLIAVYVGYSFYFSPLPQTSGVTTAEGLQDPVTIYRDSWAVPQIYATNNNDLFFSMGYVHAQDRWWQMELSRYMGMGRLHEILLSERDTILDADRLMRALDLERVARTMWQNADTATKQALNAYTDGVNAYIQSRDVQSLASEYGLLGLSGQFDNLLIYLGGDVDVELWEPYQSILLWELFELSQAQSLWQPIASAITADAVERGGDERANLYQPMSTHFPSAELDIDSTELQALYAQRLPFTETSFMQYLGFTGMHDNIGWVIGGERTRSGAGLLSNVGYAASEIPSTWYEVGLHCAVVQPDCTLSTVGFSLVGVPAILSGHNGTIAWSLNPTGYNEREFGLVTLNPDTLEYLYKGVWRPLDNRISVPPLTTISGSEVPANNLVYMTEMGALVTDVQIGRGLTIQQPVLPDDDPLATFLGIMQATSWQTFSAAFEHWLQPTMGMLYADQAGNIGFQLSGESYYTEQIVANVSHQSALVNSAPEAPIPITSLYNPSTNIITIIGGQISPSDARNAGVQSRIETLLAAQPLHTIDSSAQIQADNRSLLADDLLPWLKDIPLDDPFSSEVRDWLLDWDYQNDRSSAQATVFNLWVLEMLDSLHLSERHALNGMDRLSLLWVLPDVMQEPEHIVWDDPRTLLRETRDTHSAMVFGNLVEQLAAQSSRTYSQWQWGDIHQVDFTSRIIGERRVIDLNVVISNGPFPINQTGFATNGALDTVNRTWYWFEQPVNDAADDTLTLDEDLPNLEVWLIPSYRLVIDMGDLQNSRAMHSTGQSGHPASDHYVDMIAPWRAVDYHNLRWGVEDIRASATRELELRPQPTEE